MLTPTVTQVKRTRLIRKPTIALSEALLAYERELYSQDPTGLFSRYL